MSKFVALIPARAGSKRVKSKNILELGGHPIIAYTIAAAKSSGVFDSIIVSTDSAEIAQIASYYGAEVPFLRPSEFAGDLSPDIEWITFTIKQLERQSRSFSLFSILRPTSPFRMPGTIIRAMQKFRGDECADSLRAIEKCSQHPAKMWIVEVERMQPVMSNPDVSGTPWHSQPYQALPEVYVQNASIEIARTELVLKGSTISGEEIVPFITEGYEGFDINSMFDWYLAEKLLSEGKAVLPEVAEPSWLSVQPANYLTDVCPAD